jgi:hypothetical protein
MYIYIYYYVIDISIEQQKQIKPLLGHIYFVACSHDGTYYSIVFSSFSISSYINNSPR